MSKEEILEEFETDFTNPRAEKDGEYFHEIVLLRARRLILKDRGGMIEALRYWISLRKGPHTMLAVYIVEKLGISELKSELEVLKKDIASHKVFLPWYEREVDRALEAIKSQLESNKE